MYVIHLIILLNILGVIIDNTRFIYCIPKVLNICVKIGNLG